MIGRELDSRYRILAKLGEGAMGEVYLVEHLGLARKEALKILRSTMDDSPTLVTRFRREARATNRLQHPNIVAVHDFGRLPDGRFYITTEYAEGEPLDKALKAAGTFSVPRAVGVLAQLAEAIDHAHSRGVIHRDLKPANIILGERRGQADSLKVLDFGVAKIIAPDYAETIVATGQGEVFGTPAYMAPEQIGARADEPRIDIYSFGCIAFELVTGDVPFTGRTLEVMNAHLHTPPPRASKKVPGGVLPQVLDDLIMQCLQKDPEDRPQTGAAIAALLAPLRATLAPAAAADAAKARKRPTVSFGNAGELTTPDPGSRWGFNLDGDVSAEDSTGNAEAVAMAPTAALDRSDERLAVDAVLLQLAEALIDQGCNDFQLTITVANLAGVRGTLEGVVARMDELERARDSIEKRAKENDSRFRFAVGELRFELEQARQRGEANPDTEYQLAQLEQRMAELANQAEREVAAIDDRAITLAADRAVMEEEMAGLMVVLERLVDQIAPRFPHSPQILELNERLAGVRAALE
ncbi:MAG TPA: serine/threonine-protein kinase [Kofleriaceae bacterium]|nr:serine/threonine-protein kinase [Kofleriaceae bacterium]